MAVVAESKFLSRNALNYERVHFEEPERDRSIPTVYDRRVKFPFSPKLRFPLDIKNPVYFWIDHLVDQSVR